MKVAIIFTPGFLITSLLVGSIDPIESNPSRLQLAFGDIAVGGVERPTAHHGLRHKVPQEIAAVWSRLLKKTPLGCFFQRVSQNGLHFWFRGFLNGKYITWSLGGQNLYVSWFWAHGFYMAKTFWATRHQCGVLIESLKSEEKMIKSKEIDRRKLDMCLDYTLGCSVISSLKFHIILSI